MSKHFLTVPLIFMFVNRSQDHVESTSAQPEASSSHAVHDEDDQFWVSDDVPGILLHSDNLLAILTIKM